MSGIHTNNIFSMQKMFLPLGEAGIGLVDSENAKGTRESLIANLDSLISAVAYKSASKMKALANKLDDGFQKLYNLQPGAYKTLNHYLSRNYTGGISSVPGDFTYDFPKIIEKLKILKADSYSHTERIYEIPFPTNKSANEQKLLI